MEKEFVTYEIALALKELGFNEPCFGFFTDSKNLVPASYSKEGTEYPTNLDLIMDWASAALWQQAITWFEDRYQMSINLYKVSDSFVYTISVPYHSEIEGFHLEYFYEDSYHRTKDAVLKAIELIKKGND